MVEKSRNYSEWRQSLRIYIYTNSKTRQTNLYKTEASPCLPKWFTLSTSFSVALFSLSIRLFNINAVFWDAFNVDAAVCAQAEAQAHAHSFASLHPCTNTSTKFIISSNPFWTDIWIVGFVCARRLCFSQACVYFWLYVKCVMEMALDKMDVDAHTHTSSSYGFALVFPRFVLQTNALHLQQSNVNNTKLFAGEANTNARLNVYPACTIVLCERAQKRINNPNISNHKHLHLHRRTNRKGSEREGGWNVATEFIHRRIEECDKVGMEVLVATPIENQHLPNDKNRKIYHPYCSRFRVFRSTYMPWPSI